jgi:hypothetical protein
VFTYLVGAVNQHLEAIRMAHGEARKAVEADLAHVETELRNIEDATVQGVVGKTTERAPPCRVGVGRG